MAERLDDQPAGAHRLRASAPGRVAFLLDDLDGGGVQRTTLVLAGEFARHGHAPDLLVCRADGEFLELVPEGVRLLELERSSALRGCRVALRGDRRIGAALAGDLALRRRRLPHLDRLPALAGYLAAERPACLIAATTRINVLAVLAARASGAPVRTLLTERISVSAKLADRRWRRLLPLMRRSYPLASRVVAVSEALADDVAVRVGLPRRDVVAVHNPVIDPDFAKELEAPLDHPWFAPGAPPVVLSAGRISAQKDFETLLRAFERVRRAQPCRLVILGKNHDGRKRDARRQRLLALARELGVADDVDLPGFVLNPFPYMARAGVFVCSSRYEGLPGSLIQAMACGAPVVSTDCPTGPREILAGGRFGALVPVGDAAAMADAIAAALDAPPPRERATARAHWFSVARAFARYRELAFPGAPGSPASLGTSASLP